jgi:uncharacterized membrane protein YraQ (UPF0718 family)
MISILFYVVAGTLLIYTYVTDRGKANVAVKKSIKGFMALLPQVSFILILMGISLASVSAETISVVIGGNSGIFGSVLAIIVGAVTLIPSFITIPLGANLLENGAGLPQVAGFISALMGIGVITYPMEKVYFGTKFAVYRNIGCLLMTVLFVVLVTVVFGGAQ